MDELAVARSDEVMDNAELYFLAWKMAYTREKSRLHDAELRSWRQHCEENRRRVCEENRRRVNRAYEEARPRIEEQHRQFLEKRFGKRFKTYADANKYVTECCRRREEEQNKLIDEYNRGVKVSGQCLNLVIKRHEAGQCVGCGGIPTLYHHVSYRPNIELMVCKSCHYKIHFTDLLLHLRPPPFGCAHNYLYDRFKRSRLS